MSTAEAWTIGRLLTWTAEYLKKYGSTSPRLDAEVLLAEACSCSRIDLYTAFADEPSEEVRASFKEMVRRRAEGTPVAYLVGRKEFYSLPFEINPDVLIPRPETEHLVAEAVDRAKQLTGQAPHQHATPSSSAAPVAKSPANNRAGQGGSTGRPAAEPKPDSASKSPTDAVTNSTTGSTTDSTTDLTADSASESDAGSASEPLDQPWKPKPVRSFAGLAVADVGTGSGIIAVALAKSLAGARIWALEISKPALALASRNVEKHGVAGQVTLLESDLLAAVPTQTFDLIVSNPPYISESEYAQLPASVKNYEPKGALVSGPTGTEIVQRLLEQSAPLLRSGGWLIMEISPMIVDAVIKLVDRQRWSEPTISKDLAGLARIVSVSKL